MTGFQGYVLTELCDFSRRFNRALIDAVLISIACEGWRFRDNLDSGIKASPSQVSLIRL